MLRTCVLFDLIIILLSVRQEEETWMKLQVGDVLRIDNNDQIPVSNQYIDVGLHFTSLPFFGVLSAFISFAG